MNVLKKLTRLITNPSLALYHRMRERQEHQIPKTLLSKEHIQNCSLILNRKELLAKLQSSGVIAEIGVAGGEFTSEILAITNPETLHLIDSWGSEKYHEGHLNLVREKFHNEIKAGRVQIHRNLSVAAAESFGSDTFDWIYIDTDHSYETTWKELKRFSPNVKKGGIIAGHDYTMGNWVRGYRYGVIEAVHKFCIENDWELLYLTAEPIENQSFAIRRLKTA
jgi:predicted O-methyltransferase YrrM